MATRKKPGKKKAEAGEATGGSTGKPTVTIINILADFSPEQQNEILGEVIRQVRTSRHGRLSEHQTSLTQSQADISSLEQAVSTALSAQLEQPQQ